MGVTPLPRLLWFHEGKCSLVFSEDGLAHDEGVYRNFKKLVTIDLATFLVLKLDFYCELYSNKLKFGYFICNVI